MLCNYNLKAVWFHVMKNIRGVSKMLLGQKRYHLSDVLMT